MTNGSPPAALSIRPRVLTRRPATLPRSRRTLLAMTVVAATAMSATPVLAKKRPSPGFEPVMPVAAPARPANGSIFNAAAGYAALHEGNRARAVGDTLTILLLESTTASKTVGSKSQKAGGASIVPPTAGPLDFLDPNSLNASSQSTFNGSGNAQQTSTLASTLSVTIADVRPNGTALVRGEKRMLLSQGDEWVQFSGIVRLADIDQDNRIPSSRVADARVEYSGKGALQRASKQGWLGQFFNMISPF